MSDDRALSANFAARAQIASSSNSRLRLLSEPPHQSHEVVTHSCSIASTLGRDLKKATAKLCRQSSTLSVLVLPLRF